MDSSCCVADSKWVRFVYLWPHSHNTIPAKLVLCCSGCWSRVWHRPYIYQMDADSGCNQATHYRQELPPTNTVELCMVLKAIPYYGTNVMEVDMFIPDNNGLCFIFLRQDQNQSVLGESTVQVYTIYTIRNLAQSKESTTFCTFSSIRM